MSYHYLAFEQNLYTSELGYYHTFGIAVWQHNTCGSTFLYSLNDVSPDLTFVLSLVYRCNKHQLSPIHLLDILEDSLGV